MNTLPLAVSGHGGHNATFRVACVLVRDFGLDDDAALMLLQEYNSKLTEKWTEKELHHKVQDARRKASQRRLETSRASGGTSWSKPLPKLETQPQTVWKITPRVLPQLPSRSPAIREVPVAREIPRSASPTSGKNRSEAGTLLRDIPGDDKGYTPSIIATYEPPVSFEAVLVTEAAELLGVASLANASEGPVALDIETFGPGKTGALDPWQGDIRLLSLAVTGAAPRLIDLRAVGYDLGPLAVALAGREVIIHNAAFDALWLRQKCGLRLPRLFCTMSAARLLHAGDESQKNDLKTCLEKFMSKSLPMDQGRSNWSMPQLTAEQLTYAGNDVAYLHALKSKLEACLDSQNLLAAFRLEMDLLPAVIDMEARGFAVDREKLKTIIADAETRARESKQKVQRELSIQNPNSPAQVQEAFNAKGIHLPDTKEDTLIECACPEATLLLEYRKEEKLRQQSETLQDHIRSDGRIHSRFNPLGADSGRFSSSTPNLQNVGRGELRSIFVAAPRHTLIVADYSQIELRIAAAIAEESAMIEAFRSGEDLHRLTASKVLGKPLAEITREERQLAKAVNFGLLFGQSPKGLRRYAKVSYQVEITEEQAQRFHRRFFDAYPKLRLWHDRARQKARDNQVREVRTVSGRRRLLPGGVDKEWPRFATLVNMPVQGAAADGMKRAMTLLASALPEGAGMVSTVHDELIVETPEATAETVKELVAETMIKAMTALFPRVPIEVDVKVCRTWEDK